MPLFHIHGLIAAVLSSLAAGGQRLLHAGLQRAAASSAGSMRRRPTWYTAVPTMHQAILAARRAQRRDRSRAQPAALHPLVLGLAAAAGDGGAGGDLRLPGDRVLRHDRGGAPDGLATRCRRGARKPGTVGVAAGPEVAIMDDGRRACCRPATIGEIVIRGPNVTAGYENNPEANADGLRRWLVPHRRPGHDGRRRLSHASPAG